MTTTLHPAGAGETLIAAITAELAEDELDPDARDTALLETAGRLADRMASLEKLVTTDGERTISDSGIVRLHPAIAEYRQHSIALSKVLVAIAMNDTTAGRKDPKKVKAAENRWRAHNEAKSRTA
jgi:hypothetical protein